MHCVGALWKTACTTKKGNKTDDDKLDPVILKYMQFDNDLVSSEDFEQQFSLKHIFLYATSPLVLQLNISIKSTRTSCFEKPLLLANIFLYRFYSAAHWSKIVTRQQKCVDYVTHAPDNASPENVWSLF